jgi:hypothetical protein
MTILQHYFGVTLYAVSKTNSRGHVYLFSTGNGLVFVSAQKVNRGMRGVDAGISTSKYSTGRGLANLGTSLP